MKLIFNRMAQTPSRPEFEVASIKINKNGGRRGSKCRSRSTTPHVAILIRARRGEEWVQAKEVIGSDIARRKWVVSAGRRQHDR
jgi:hypothetical protein